MNKILACVWVAALKHSVAYVNQRGKKYYETVHWKLSEEVAEISAEKEGSYGGKSADSVRKHVNNHSTDVHKFARTLPSVRTCKLTEVTEDQNLVRAIAVYDGKRDCAKRYLLNAYLSFSLLISIALLNTFYWQ